jgi:hypothetical protein
MLELKALHHLIQPFGTALRIHAGEGPGTIHCSLTFMYMESCVFVCEDFPKENRMQANKATNIG